MRVGAIDCGTNSIRLLIADVTAEEGGARSLVDIERTMEVVRLGQGVDRTGRLDPEALARTLAASRRYAQDCRDAGCEAVRFVATSATRDAQNSADFVEGVREAFADFGVEPEVVSGDEEAELSFAGATGALAAAEIEGPYLVVDLGGGSTEIVRGTHDVMGEISLDIGCVRMTERHLQSDPPTQAEVDAARADIADALDQAEAAVGFGGVHSLVGLAGSITTVTAHALRLPSYDSGAIHLATLSPQEAMGAAEELVQLTRAERAALGFMHRGRVDVIGAGALVWYEIIDRVQAASPGVAVVTSERDILDGIALSAAERATA